MILPMQMALIRRESRGVGLISADLLTVCNWSHLQMERQSHGLCWAWDGTVREAS